MTRQEIFNVQQLYFNCKLIIPKIKSADLIAEFVFILLVLKTP